MFAPPSHPSLSPPKRAAALRVALATTPLMLACAPTASGPPAAPEEHDPEAQVLEPPEASETSELEGNEPDVPASCPKSAPREGFESCRAVELTGDGACEEICTDPQPARDTDCCVGATDVVVFSGKAELLRVSACENVPPECANVHGHGNMDAELRVLRGPPVELVVVEGGCEMRAMMHGYVPEGVAAWSGCNHQRYRWDGERLVAVER